MSKERKYFGGRIKEVKSETRNGVEVGIIAGYIATWDIDRGGDQFVRGAFVDSIREHQIKQRQVRLKDHHGRTVGGFPIESVYEDEVGLYGIGEVNLEVEQGRELMSLARQGVLVDFSIGYSSVEDRIDEGLRKITKAIIYEGSVVDEPMNPFAKITEVKSVVPYQDLPLGERDAAWDSTEAVKRVRELTDSEDSPSAGYRRAFLWYDKEDSENFGAYKLPIADVVNDKLTVIPRAIFAAAAALQGARGGVDIPDSDRPGVINHIERYYAKMDMESPFKSDEKQYFTAEVVKDWTTRDIERALRNSGVFSKGAAKIIAAKVQSVDKSTEVDDNMSELLNELKSLQNCFR